MRKTVAFGGLVLVLTLVTALVATSALADEFKYDGPPAFTLTHPGGAPAPNKSPNNVWNIKTAMGLMVGAYVGDIPEGITLKDVGEKAYMPELSKNMGASAKLSENKEITLSDGTKAYYSEINWRHSPTSTDIITMVVSVYKDGKRIYVDAHPWDSWRVAEKIVKSLKFQ